MIYIRHEFPKPLLESSANQDTVLQEKYDRQKGVYQQCIPLAQLEINYGKGAYEKEDHKHDCSRQYKYKENPD